VLRSEWTKLRSVRSTYWTLLAAVVTTVGLSALISAIYVSQYPGMKAADRANFDPTSFSLSGVFLAQLAIGVLGVLIITGEYSTGAIRSTFAAVPQRRMVLAAKATVFSAVTLVVGMVSCFAAFFIGQAILSGQSIQAHIGDPGVLRAVAGSGLYLAVLGLLALGVGTLIRHSAGAISALFGVILVLPALVLALPWSDAISRWLPSNAGGAISATVQAGPNAPGGPMLSPWVGLGVFFLYAAAALVCAGITLRRRDA
jgi:ABC-type transport system involved in multi-copper enzyme maturation permease subunit